MQESIGRRICQLHTSSAILLDEQQLSGMHAIKSWVLCSTGWRLTRQQTDLDMVRPLPPFPVTSKASYPLNRMAAAHMQPCNHMANSTAVVAGPSNAMSAHRMILHQAGSSRLHSTCVQRKHKHQHAAAAGSTHKQLSSGTFPCLQQHSEC